MSDGEAQGSGREARTHMRFPGVRAPKPLLSREAERQLSARQLELLDALEMKLAKSGLGERTMAEIAAGVGCSLRTLYAIAPSKDELLLILCPSHPLAGQQTVATRGVGQADDLFD